MRRNKAPAGDRVVSIRIVPVLLAACVGYLLGNAHIEAFRTAGVTAADAVASRFPQNLTQDWRNASLTAATAFRAAAVKLHDPKSDIVAGIVAAGSDTELALLDPEPMAPQTRQDASPDTMPQAALQTASADASEPLPAPIVNPQAPALPVARKPVQSPAAAVPAPTVRVAAMVPHRPVNERPGYILNDAQIASIKARLHMTPDQEQMWPAVEAALRNMAYTHPPQTRGRASGETQTATVDPNAVQGLKSAAVPLILSFNDEQKEEVRNLVHVMGLDQLASQF
jgi:hypothetical protein